MKYICTTHVDAKTKILCTAAPMRTGPAFLKIKSLQLDWADESTWPVELDPTGRYLRSPKYYGTCDDDADTSIAGVLEVISEAEWLQRKRDEFYARQPYPSWVFDEATLVWSSPVAYPTDGKIYRWDEPTVSWTEVSDDT
jgi:hypothetical protein